MLDQKKIVRTRQDRILAGVLGGLGQYFNINPAILRIAVALLAIYYPVGGVLALAYIAAWILLPEGPLGSEKTFPPLFGDLKRSRTERMVAGVCGGISRYYKLDVNILRIFFVVLTLLSGGVLAGVYLILWMLLPQENL
ncbi:PspC domain-containing protein [Deinococcus misasensis]|uniref:PspC domain-containing protein n=1 Tax=Deinococcus misasensis TaxID=392413 RepID=UPI00068FEAB8|nr:PspC domain-containing protein [Deinococcus misasensis]